MIVASVFAGWSNYFTVQTYQIEGVSDSLPIYSTIQAQSNGEF